MKQVSLILHPFVLYTYVWLCSLLTPAQSGFRPGHSTQDLLLKVVEDWKSALDCDDLVGTVFIDLSKAFDSIDHGLLLGIGRFFQNKFWHNRNGKAKSKMLA